MQQNGGRLTGLDTSWVETAFSSTLLEERYRVEMGRRGRRRKQLLDNLKEKRRYWNLKEEAPDRTVWRTRFGRGYGRAMTTHNT